MQKHQRHFNATLESLNEEQTDLVVSTEMLVGGALLTGIFGFLAWDKYNTWRKKTLREKKGETPDGREKEFEFNLPKLAQVTQDRAKKTYADPKWVEKQKLVDGQVNADRITHYLGNTKSLSFPQVERDFRASLVAAQRWVDQTATIVETHNQYMRSKIIPIVAKVTDENGEQLAEQVIALARGYTLPQAKVRSLPSLIGHSKSTDRHGHYLEYVNVFDGKGTTLPSLTAEQIGKVGALLVESSAVVEKLLEKIPKPEFYWEDLQASEDFIEALIPFQHAMDLWFEPAGSADPLRFHAFDDVVQAVIDSALALERWAYSSIKH